MVKIFYRNKRTEKEGLKMDELETYIIEQDITIILHKKHWEKMQKKINELFQHYDEVRISHNGNNSLFVDGHIGKRD